MVGEDRGKSFLLRDVPSAFVSVFVHQGFSNRGTPIARYMKLACDSIIGIYVISKYVAEYHFATWFSLPIITVLSYVWLLPILLLLFSDFFFHIYTVFEA